MIKSEISKVLVIAMAIDPRLNAADQAQFVARVEGWNLALHETMTFEFARDFVGRHYASETDSLMPAHLNAAWRIERDRMRSLDEQKALESAPKGKGMPDEVRAKFAEMGFNLSR